MNAFFPRADGKSVLRNRLPLQAFLCAAGILYTQAQPMMERSAPLQNLLDGVVRESVSAFSDKNLKTNELAVTLLDLREPSHITAASHRGDVRIYPASVIKLFYLVAAHQWMEDGKITETPELRRALHDMVVDSYNEATHYVVDLITGTTSGPELSTDEMVQWENKRNVINRYFVSRGYANINANQKPWCEGPYGRERAFVGEKFTNRNALTTDATARLLCDIALGRAVSPARSVQMLELLKRDPTAPSSDPDDQSHGFSGSAVPPGAKLWSKAGWTSETRHDAAYIELPDGTKIILVTFTVGHANDREIIPSLARKIIAELKNETNSALKK